ncbi:hypothetical protein FQN52_006966 [Onygenales sp. PD_12]|nr:hypothetical protein FQN52_006966 [Onygenales sp. PD_12]
MENQSPIAKYFKDPFLRLCFKLRRLWRPPPAPAPAPAPAPDPDPVVKQNPNELINKLPLDIIYYLGTSDYLSLVDKSSLALVCKNFWNVLNGPKVLQPLRRPAVGVGLTDNEAQAKEQRLEFLQRLEIQFPKHLLCHHCVTFHLRPKPAWRTPQDLSIIGRCDMENGVLFSTWGSLPLLPFTLAQEIMNRHRYGDEYGHYLVTDLGFNFPFYRRHADDSRYSFGGRIINDELVVKIDYSTLFLNDSLVDRTDALQLIGVLSLMHWTDLLKAQCTAKYGRQGGSTWGLAGIHSIPSGVVIRNLHLAVLSKRGIFG